MPRSMLRPVQSVVVAAVLLGAVAVLGAPRARSSVPVAGQSDFAGLVDIGGRRLYLECQGTGSPTVILEAGGGGGDSWSQALLDPEAQCRAPR